MRTSDKVAAQFNDNDRRDSLHDEIVMWTQENAVRIYREINEKVMEDGYRKNLLFDCSEVECRWEEPLTRERGSIGGYVDLMIVGSAAFRYPVVGCEIKPRIYCVGDVIRQIRYYRTLNHELRHYVEYCVISPDDCYAKLLEDQGIRFIKYTP